GLRLGGQAVAGDSSGANDPLAAVRSLQALATPDGTSLLILSNFHKFLGSPEIIQAVARQVNEGKLNRTFIVALAPIVEIPVELKKQFVVLEHPLPTREQLLELARGVAGEPNELPQDGELERTLDASAGLTRLEAEGAYSLALVRHGRIEPSTIWMLKSQTLKKSGLLGLHQGDECFDDLGGLEALKTFCRRSLLRQGDPDPARRPRGVMLLSPPGCGKSQFAKSLGNEVGRPTLSLDLGSLYGSLVGETERRVRKALKIIEAMAPCVCLIDEIEKGLGGATSSGNGDSGVSSRLFGYLLSWLNDRTSDVYMVATCNDISKLPPEFSRAERWDGIFFVDLPGPEQRKAIWDLYVGRFGLDPGQPKPKDDGFTGAEIKSCCRLAALLDLPLVEAAKNVVPMSVTAAESVQRLRTWAGGRCLSADEGGIYQCAKTGSSKRRRKLPTNPSTN
ncbi:MAG: AAA family ATPase, partial [Planctomycetales bacterium]